MGKIQNFQRVWYLHMTTVIEYLSISSQPQLISEVLIYNNIPLRTHNFFIIRIRSPFRETNTEFSNYTIGFYTFRVENLSGGTYLYLYRI